MKCTCKCIGNQIIVPGDSCIYFVGLKNIGCENMYMYYFSMLEVLDLYVMFIWYEHISIVCFLLSNQENKCNVLQKKHVPDLIMYCFIFVCFPVTFS